MKKKKSKKTLECFFILIMKVAPLKGLKSCFEKNAAKQESIEVEMPIDWTIVYELCVSF